MSTGPTVEELAEILVARFAREGITAVYDPALTGLRFPSDAGLARDMFLSNFHAEYGAAPAGERAALVDQWVASLMAPSVIPATLAGARSLLLPTVRSGAYFDEVHLIADARGEPAVTARMASRPLDALVAFGLAVDAPTMMSMVSDQHLADWHATWDEVYPIALDNLRGRSAESFETPQRGVFVSPWRDNYDASRILLPELIATLAVKGRPVALVPNRDTLIITGDRDAAGLLAAAALAEQAYQDPRPIDLAARCWDGAAWSLCIPDASAEAAQRYRALRAVSTADLYEGQKGLLAAAAEQRGDDVFVAAFMVVEADDGEYRTVAALTRGVPTLLPQADLVSFIDVALPEDQQMLVTAPWEIVYPLLRTRWTPLGLSPERWRVERGGFPTDAELDELRTAAPR